MHDLPPQPDALAAGTRHEPSVRGGHEIAAAIVRALAPAGAAV